MLVENLSKRGACRVCTRLKTISKTVTDCSRKSHAVAVLLLGSRRLAASSGPLSSLGENGRRGSSPAKLKAAGKTAKVAEPLAVLQKKAS